MYIALTGASGLIGSALSQHLTEAGYAVIALVRSTSRRDHIAPFVDRFVVGNQDDDSVWPELLDGADCVIHNSFDWQPLKTGDVDQHLQSNLLASIRLLEAAAPRQFVYLSSVAVHHDMSPRWKGMIDEEHPTRPGNLYGAYKAAVESHLWSAHFNRGQHTCALRPCAVYGVDPNLQRSIGFPFIEQLRSGARFDRTGGGKFVHVEDVAAAAVATVGNPEAAGKAYHLADCYARWADIAAMLAELLDMQADIDFSSPDAPRNQFDKTAANELGVPLNRGWDGIKQYLRELIEVCDARTEEHAVG